MTKPKKLGYFISIPVEDIEKCKTKKEKRDLLNKHLAMAFYSLADKMEC